MAGERSSARHLVLATRNAHKTAEFAAILGPQFVVRDLVGARGLPAITETGSTFAENATLKATGISNLVPELVVADDSGLEVDALGGAPGVYSARYAGAHATDAQNISKLLLELRNSGATGVERRAQFRCALVLAKRGEILRAVEGNVIGRITDVAQGSGGFGYDPVFVPEGYRRTFAELGLAVKSRISHRAKAIQQLRDYLLHQTPA